MSRDFGAADMPNAPFILLRSYVTAAFRDQKDQLGAPDSTNPLLDIDPANSSSTIPVSVVEPGLRAHRTDIFSFFARDRFPRMTGGGTVSSGVQPFVADMATQEAWIWYGHLKLPDNNGSFSAGTNPGAFTFTGNPNNFYSSQWLLGRVAMLLHEEDESSNEIITTQTVLDQSGNAAIGSPIKTHQTHYTVDGTDLAPLSYQSRIFPPYAGHAATDYLLESSRYDLAGTSMVAFKPILKNYITANPNPPAGSEWWEQLMLGRRFQASPFALKSGSQARLTPDNVAQQVPVFLANCTQFIVEYAGDFIAQDTDSASPTYGALLDACVDGSTSPVSYKPVFQGVRQGTDGEIDFVLVPDPITPTIKRKQIRWYGFPRDTNGNGTISVNEGDVCPLRDTIHLIPSGTPAWSGVSVPFEKMASSTLAEQPDYSASGVVAASRAVNGPPYLSLPGDYTCAWGPDDPIRPSMIRIVIGLDDPNGHLSQTQFFEFVFKVQ
ncbi:MAG TPA: hypothetical protein VHD56_05210 [Tepidisphaeraceae bacterium]|nr:hypothetical protein [Tepidisphaeraceae bacterium]